MSYVIIDQQEHSIAYLIILGGIVKVPDQDGGLLVRDTAGQLYQMLFDVADDERGESQTGPGHGKVLDGDGLQSGQTHSLGSQHQLNATVEQLQQLRCFQAYFRAGLQ